MFDSVIPDIAENIFYDLKKELPPNFHKKLGKINKSFLKNNFENMVDKVKFRKFGFEPKMGSRAI